jgi:hypothetical protein
MSDGIISQYGFLFQRLVFLDIAISHASMERFFTYEGVEDIDVSQSGNVEDLAMVAQSKECYIQVKSGTVNKTCWAKVLGNWLLVDGYENSTFTLVCENELDFDISESSTIDAVYSYFDGGKTMKKSSIARRVYDKFILNNDEASVKQIITNLSNKCEVYAISLDEVSARISQKVSDTYCKDIKVYDKAKSIRVQRLIEYFMTEIDSAIKNKKAYTLTFPKMMELIGRVTLEISDNKYTVDITAIKKRKQKEAEDLVSNSGIREVRQLKLVKDDPGFVAGELVKELLYKDFREVYVDGGVVVSNIEDNAYTNYQDALLELDDSPSARQVFMQTTRKEIESSIMDNSPIYRNGCYVYLTGEEAESSKKISWGDEDE